MTRCISSVFYFTAQQYGIHITVQYHIIIHITPGTGNLSLGGQTPAAAHASFGRVTAEQHIHLIFPQRAHATGL